MNWLLTSSLCILQKKLNSLKNQKTHFDWDKYHFQFLSCPIWPKSSKPLPGWDPWESGNVDWSDPSGVDNPSAAVSSHNALIRIEQCTIAHQMHTVEFLICRTRTCHRLIHTQAAPKHGGLVLCLRPVCLEKQITKLSHAKLFSGKYGSLPSSLV